MRFSGLSERPNEKNKLLYIVGFYINYPRLFLTKNDLCIDGMHDCWLPDTSVPHETLRTQKICLILITFVASSVHFVHKQLHFTNLFWYSIWLCHRSRLYIVSKSWQCKDELENVHVQVRYTGFSSFYAWQHICYSAYIPRPSVRLSVTRVLLLCVKTLNASSKFFHCLIGPPF